VREEEQHARWLEARRAQDAEFLRESIRGVSLQEPSEEEALMRTRRSIYDMPIHPTAQVSSSASACVSAMCQWLQL
jgi:hypothetical protein